MDQLILDHNTDLPVQKALELALGAAKGVAQLHTIAGGPVAHVDIRSDQFLINEQGTVLLNDLNLLKYVGQNRLPKKSGEKCSFQRDVAGGTWRAPEEYGFTELDEKIDIYSLGVVFWSLRARANPYTTNKLPNKEFQKAVSTGALQLEAAAMSDYPQAMRDLVFRMWDLDPSQRPSAPEVVEQLQAILQNY